MYFVAWLLTGRKGTEFIQAYFQFWLAQFFGESEDLKILISEWISLLGIIAIIYSESLADDSFADDDIILIMT